jgi:hypothetical protein
MKQAFFLKKERFLLFYVRPDQSTKTNPTKSYTLSKKKCVVFIGTKKVGGEINALWKTERF